MEENWQQRVLQEIDTRTQLYKEQDLKNYSVPTLRNLIAKLPFVEASAQKREVLQGEIEAVVILLRGLVFKNIALGIPIGVVIGLLVGSYLDRKAEKEGRVI